MMTFVHPTTRSKHTMRGVGQTRIAFNRFNRTQYGDPTRLASPFMGRTRG